MFPTLSTASKKAHNIAVATDTALSDQISGRAGFQRLTKSNSQPASAPSDNGEISHDATAFELPQLLSLTRVECGCDLGSKKRTLERVAALLMDAFDDEELSDMHVLDALINRERLGSTAIGEGVALPHARMPSLTEPAAALISLKEGVDYQSIDGQPVDLIVGLLVPEHCKAHLTKSCTLKPYNLWKSRKLRFYCPLQCS